MVFTQTDGLLAIPVKFAEWELHCFFYKFAYKFKSENKKVIVISPMPNAFYEEDYDPNAERSPGDVVCGYRIENASGLIGSLERKTLLTYS